MTHLLFLLSGEHETIPFSELCATLEAERVIFKEIIRAPQIAVLEGDEAYLEKIAHRCSMTKLCGIEIFHCKASKSLIYEEVRKVDIKSYIKAGMTFAVRIKRIRESSREIRTEILEREIGRILLEKFPEIKVNLTSPDKTFIGFLSGGWFFFGLKVAEIPTKEFLDRSPLRRPYFHPSTMHPKFARCLVNLVRVKRGDILLDPFCGVGGILIEAGLIGCRPIGFDIKEERARETLENLYYYGIDPVSIGVADARNLPIRQVDTIVADPPYGRTATTLGARTEEVIADFLHEAYRVLPKGGYLCLLAPKHVRLSKLGEKIGFKLIEHHFVPVHRSLIREVAVFRKQ
jgi:tRNA (guanine10-N2)-dimethyltransferase